MINNFNEKGLKMALPFLAGIAAGALAVVAWNKKDELFKEAKKGLKKGKSVAVSAYEKGKDEVASLVSKAEKEGKRVEKEAKKVAKRATKKPSTRKKSPAKIDDTIIA